MTVNLSVKVEANKRITLVFSIITGVVIKANASYFVCFSLLFPRNSRNGVILKLIICCI